MRIPRSPFEPRALPLPEPDYSVPVGDVDGYSLLTNPSQWYVFPVSEEGVETLIRGTLIEAERDMRKRWAR